MKGTGFVDICMDWTICIAGIFWRAQLLFLLIAYGWMFKYRRYSGINMYINKVKNLEGYVAHYRILIFGDMAGSIPIYPFSICALSFECTTNL